MELLLLRCMEKRENRNMRTNVVLSLIFLLMVFIGQALVSFENYPSAYSRNYSKKVIFRVRILDEDLIRQNSGKDFCGLGKIKKLRLDKKKTVYFVIGPEFDSLSRAFFYLDRVKNKGCKKAKILAISGNKPVSISNE